MASSGKVRERSSHGISRKRHSGCDENCNISNQRSHSHSSSTPTLLPPWQPEISAVRFFGGARVRQPQRWRQRLQKWAAIRMEKLICVSQGVYRHCQDVEHIDASKLALIPNGIRLERTESHRCWNELNIPSAARVLLFARRLDGQNGVGSLLR